MENIILQVPESTARKWQQASDDTKDRAVKAVREILETTESSDVSVDEDARLKEAIKFFSNLSADFAGYKFDREEANER